MTESYHIHPLGDAALMVEFGETISVSFNQKILQAARHLKNQHFPWLEDLVPAYTTLTIFYNPVKVQDPFPYSKVRKIIAQKLSEVTDEPEEKGKTIEIPVCYGGDYGPDLEEVASLNSLTQEEVISLHSGPLYRVFFLGFSPGFPFLGGMDERIASPRKKVPRTQIPEGSVGIAGQQTGVYPQASPGGWQIIGRTPVSLFSVDRNPPALLQPGDWVSFVPIAEDEFDSRRDARWGSM